MDEITNSLQTLSFLGRIDEKLQSEVCWTRKAKDRRRAQIEANLARMKWEYRFIVSQYRRNHRDF
jgi:hypothetical protein